MFYSGFMHKILFLLLINVYRVTKAEIDNFDKINDFSIQYENNNTNIAKNNSKLKTFKKQKYKFEVNKHSWGAAALSLCGFGFPLGQIYNRDYWRAILFGSLGISGYGLWGYISYRNKKIRDQAESGEIKWSEAERRIIREAVAVHFIIVTVITSAIQAFISASFKTEDTDKYENNIKKLDTPRFKDKNIYPNDLQTKQEMNQENNKEKAIKKDNIKLKRLKETKKIQKSKYKYDFFSKETFGATAMAICGFGFLPLGQIYNGDYKTALSFGLVNIINILITSLLPNRNFSEGYSTNFALFFSVWGLTWITEICQAFISASMKVNDSSI